ncbi:hypothetical protein IG3_05332 [Bacillus cereus HuA2-1]|uniref:Uncharacterized protein n=1 Tax=Bacillus cereus HuA2-1 TaxID=1053201 RepID=J8Y2S5_BACCE|nr:hypothetical protein IG3_05332 [Bacillus cereus HuA2-1]
MISFLFKEVGVIGISLILSVAALSFAVITDKIVTFK